MTREDEVLAWLYTIDAERVASAGVGMPCCTMVALWLLAMRGGVPVGVSTYAAATGWGVRHYVTNVTQARLWWERANVWDGKRPWSALTAAEEITGGRYVVPRLVSTSMPAPSLTPGRWHVIQRWQDPGKLVGGHTYLVRAGATSADPVTVLQSSEGKRLRVSAGSWDGTAGLTGLHVGAVVLPAMEA